ncbi:hypothetical protein [Deinococcus hohokamensis]|uniref:Uncharacterized protein n=1 Tax=Deinococcus hohokamensis TaxID=309883 RepID=A0ABV9IDR5_9DEIO
MTPPDWFLSLLGAGAVALLIVLLLPLRPRRKPTRRRRRLTPEQQAGHDEMEARRLAHERDVMRPGLLHAAFSRDSVSMGDDSSMEGHWRLLTFEENLPMSAVLGPPIHKMLASIQGGQATWVIQLHEPLQAPAPPLAGRVRVTDVAVVAQQWPVPRLLVPDFPVSQVGAGLLFALYLAQQDPDEVYKELKDRREEVAAVQPHPSRQRSDNLLNALRHRPNPRVQETYTRYTYSISEIPAEKRVMLRLRPAPRSGTRST